MSLNIFCWSKELGIIYPAGYKMLSVLPVQIATCGVDIRSNSCNSILPVILWKILFRKAECIASFHLKYQCRGLSKHSSLHTVLYISSASYLSHLSLARYELNQ